MTKRTMVRYWTVMVILQFLCLLILSYVCGVIITEKQIQKKVGQFLYEAEQTATPNKRIGGKK